MLGYNRCSLCIIERIPYALAIIILILNYNFKKDQVFYSVLLLLVFGFSFLVSIYHFGIEQGFIDETSVCGTGNAGFITKDEILKSFQEINISCKDATFRIFSLSLTVYNMIISVLMFLISLKIFLINYDYKK